MLCAFFVQSLGSWCFYFRSILNGVTRILDINTDAGSTEMHKLDDTDGHTADGDSETTKKQTTTSEDSKPDKQRTVKIEKVCILQGCGNSKISTCPETSHNVLDQRKFYLLERTD